MPSKIGSKAIALRMGVLVAFILGLIGTSPIQSVNASKEPDWPGADQRASISLLGGQTVNRIGVMGKPTKPVPKPTQTSTRTASPTITSSPYPTRTKTATATLTRTASSTFTPSPTATRTYTSTATSTPIASPTLTQSPSPTQTDTATSTTHPTFTFSPSRTPTNTPTSTSTPTASPTPTSFPSLTPTSTPTLTSTPIPIAGLLGYWKFDEDHWAGDCVTADMLDSSGNRHHGIACINGDAPFPVPGKFGNAGRYDGVNQYANMGPGFNFTSSFTATLWIALDDYNWCGPAGTSQHIIGTHDLRTPIGSGRGWGIYWDCDGLAWELTNSTGSAIGSYGFIQPSPFPANGSWHHAALVYDATVPSATLYWDGLPVYSESGTLNVPSFLFNNGEPLTVNGLPYAPGAGAPGEIDEARVYNRALSPEEILSIYSGLSH